MARFCSHFPAQIVSNKLPDEYLYHGMSAPWFQCSVINLMTEIINKDCDEKLEEISEIDDLMEETLAALDYRYKFY